MSGIGGILNKNNLAIDQIAMANLNEELISRGPDSGGMLHQGSIGMVHRAFVTDQKLGAKYQPLVSTLGHLICWDGRLDNRDDLLRQLPEALCGDKDDVEIVLASYLNWGADFLERIVGDFVLSLWDPFTKSLLLARDPFGTRTLYYSENSTSFVWSSTLEALLRGLQVDPEIDENYVAGFLALHPEMWRSPYKNILSVEPGCVVTTGIGVRTHTRRFWKPDPQFEIRYEKDAQYEEQFRQLFREAVRCRLRAHGPVWLELSGGLDSSSIACVADDIISTGEAATPQLDTVSYLEDEATTSYDYKFLKALEDSRGKTGHYFRGEGHWVRITSPQAAFISKPSTALCVAGSNERLCRLMAQNNARVLLNGLGGDQLMWSIPTSSPELADLLFQCQPLQLHRQLKIWSRLLKRPYWQLFYREALFPLIPNRLSLLCQGQMKAATWIETEFAKKTDLQEQMQLPPDPIGYRLPSKKMQSRGIFFIVSSIATGNYWEHAAFDRTYPFLHRPLVEFVMAIPFQQKLRPGETRSLMRRALKGVLPEAILHRQSKGVVAEAFCRGLEKEWQVLRPMLMNARVCEKGYVNQQALMRAVDLARHGQTFNIAALLQTIALEIWLRSVEHHLPARRVADHHQLELNQSSSTKVIEPAMT